MNLEPVVEKLWREMCDLAVGELFSYNFGDDRCATVVSLHLANHLRGSSMVGEFKIIRRGRNLTVRRVNE